ncbi:MAG: vanadium-dependent haloperoxidase, partial [Bacteroidota bacterium]
EQKFRKQIDKRSVPSYLASFTKGLQHDEESGLVCNPKDFQLFVKGIDSGSEVDFLQTPIGPDGYTGDTLTKCRETVPGNRPWKSEKARKNNVPVRAWESQGAGLTFDLEGPDAQAETMPPAPAVGSDELASEMAEVYAMALLRDVPFTQIVDLSGKYFNTLEDKEKGVASGSVEEVVKLLNQQKWFNRTECCDLTDAERSRLRGPFKGQTVFRGITRGDDIGPYLSQFFLAGNTGITGNDAERAAAAGLVTYGAVNIDHRVRVATPCVDYMQTWFEWFDVQEGADLRGLETYIKEPGRRFITTPRDLATYVHYDALYEAYLNACLYMLSAGIPFDPGIPFQAEDFADKQQGFAQFGGPHILSLVTEVATRALKAVRFQKFNVHRRFRPEGLAGRFAKLDNPDVGNNDMLKMAKHMKGILNLVEKKNPADANLQNNYLLPMAFCEGSPMHPAYGAGHATVAGACVTILKAFFDHKHPLAVNGNAGMAFVPKDDGLSLTEVPVVDKDGNPSTLTVEGELNKICSNVSIGRNWAGVHFFTDYIESIRLGEQIAIGILEEQKLTYGENFSMTVPLFDGGSVRI